MSEKKNICLMVLKILEKHSIKKRRLTKTEICRLLEKEYEFTCDRRTVSSALESLILLGYPVEFQTVRGKKSNLFLRPNLSENDKVFLQIALASSEYIDTKTQKDLAQKLSLTDALIDSAKSVKGGNASDDFSKTISIIQNAIISKTMLNFSICASVINNKHQFNKENGTVVIYLVKPIEVIFAYGRALLFCEIGDTEIYRYFPIEHLYDVQPSGCTFEISEGTTVPLPQNKIEATSLCFSERARAVIRVDNNYLAELASMLGQGCEILNRYGDKTELAVITDLRALKGLILTYGAHAEALSPTKLRRAVALELQSASAKYPEIRRLRGTI